MKLTLVRHGETDGNKNETLQGDDPLNEKGIEQVKKLALRLKNEQFDKIYVSDLIRTKRTAEEITKFHSNIEIIYEPRIRERDNGIFTGKAYGSMRKSAMEAGIAYPDYKPENGESIRELQARVHAFLNEITQKEKGNILVVTHGGPMTNILLKILNAPEEEYMKYLPKINTAVTVIETDNNNNNNQTVTTLNCTKHLE